MAKYTVEVNTDFDWELLKDGRHLATLLDTSPQVVASIADALNKEQEGREDSERIYAEIRTALADTAEEG